MQVWQIPLTLYLEFIPLLSLWRPALSKRNHHCVQFARLHYSRLGNWALPLGPVVIFCVSTALKQSRGSTKLGGNATCAKLLSNCSFHSKGLTIHATRCCKINSMTHLTTIVIPALPWRHSMLITGVHLVHVILVITWHAMLLLVWQLQGNETLTSMLENPIRGKETKDSYDFRKALVS